MLGTNPRKSAFTLIELVVTILIMAVVLTVAIPLFRGGGRDAKRQFVEDFQVLVRRSMRMAMESGNFYCLVFDLENKKITIGQTTGEVDVKGSLKFELLKDRRASVRIPHDWELVKFFISGEDELGRPGVKIDKVWSYISPQGTLQPIQLVFDMGDEEEHAREKNRLELSANPFTGAITTPRAVS